MPRRLALLLVVLVAIAAYWFVFRNLYYRSAEQERSAAGNGWFNNGFSVAIVWPPHTDMSLVQGVTLASEEVNAAGGPLAGKIRLRFFVETDDGGAVARDIVKYRDVLAVIGHELPGTSIPASITYEKHGVLFLSPKSTDPRLTDHQFTHVFRLTPDDKAIAQVLAQFAVAHQWKRIGVLYGRADHGESASAQFVTAAKHDDLDVAFEQSFFHEIYWGLEDFRPMLGTIRTQKFDAIMVADQMPWVGQLFLDMNIMGVKEPILGTDKLDGPALWEIAQKSGTDLYVASAVDPDSKDPDYLGFRERFRRRFHADPGYGSSQGYDAFMLFVNACVKSQSADPVVVATTLRNNTWNGLFDDDYAFDSDGDIVGRDLSIKHLQNGVLRTVTEIKENP